MNFCITFADHCTSKDTLFGNCASCGVSTKYLSHFLTEPHVAQQLPTITYAIKNKSQIVCGLSYCFKTPFSRFINQIWHCPSVSKVNFLY